MPDEPMRPPSPVPPLEGAPQALKFWPDEPADKVKANADIEQILADNPAQVEGVKPAFITYLTNYRRFLEGDAAIADIAPLSKAPAGTVRVREHHLSGDFLQASVIILYRKIKANAGNASVNRRLLTEYYQRFKEFFPARTLKPDMVAEIEQLTAAGAEAVSEDALPEQEGLLDDEEDDEFADALRIDTVDDSLPAIPKGEVDDLPPSADDRYSREKEINPVDEARALNREMMAEEEELKRQVSELLAPGVLERDSLQTLEQAKTAGAKLSEAAKTCQAVYKNYFTRFKSSLDEYANVSISRSKTNPYYYHWAVKAHFRAINNQRVEILDSSWDWAGRQFGYLNEAAEKFRASDVPFDERKEMSDPQLLEIAQAVHNGYQSVNPLAWKSPVKRGERVPEAVLAVREIKKGLEDYYGVVDPDRVERRNRMLDRAYDNFSKACRRKKVEELLKNQIIAQAETLSPTGALAYIDRMTAFLNCGDLAQLDEQAIIDNSSDINSLPDAHIVEFQRVANGVAYIFGRSALEELRYLTRNRGISEEIGWLRNITTPAFAVKDELDEILNQRNVPKNWQDAYRHFYMMQAFHLLPVELNFSLDKPPGVAAKWEAVLPRLQADPPEQLDINTTVFDNIVSPTAEEIAAHREDRQDERYEEDLSECRERALDLEEDRKALVNKYRVFIRDGLFVRNLPNGDNRNLEKALQDFRYPRALLKYYDSLPEAFGNLDAVLTAITPRFRRNEYLDEVVIRKGDKDAESRRLYINTEWSPDQIKRAIVDYISRKESAGERTGSRVRTRVLTEPEGPPVALHPEAMLSPAVAYSTVMSDAGVRSYVQSSGKAAEYAPPSDGRVKIMNIGEAGGQGVRFHCYHIGNQLIAAFPKYRDPQAYAPYFGDGAAVTAKNTSIVRITEPCIASLETGRVIRRGAWELSKPATGRVIEPADFPARNPGAARVRATEARAPIPPAQASEPEVIRRGAPVVREARPERPALEKLAEPSNGGFENLRKRLIPDELMKAAGIKWYTLGKGDLKRELQPLQEFPDKITPALDATRQAKKDFSLVRNKSGNTRLDDRYRIHIQGEEALTTEIINTVDNIPTIVKDRELRKTLVETTLSDYTARAEQVSQAFTALATEIVNPSAVRAQRPEEPVEVQWEEEAPEADYRLSADELLDQGMTVDDEDAAETIRNLPQVVEMIKDQIDLRSRDVDIDGCTAERFPGYVKYTVEDRGYEFMVPIIGAEFTPSMANDFNYEGGSFGDRIERYSAIAIIETIDHHEPSGKYKEKGHVILTNEPTTAPDELERTGDEETPPSEEPAIDAERLSLVRNFISRFEGDRIRPNFLEEEGFDWSETTRCLDELVKEGMLATPDSSMTYRLIRKKKKARKKIESIDDDL